MIDEDGISTIIRGDITATVGQNRDGWIWQVFVGGKLTGASSKWWESKCGAVMDVNTFMDRLEAARKPPDPPKVVWKACRGTYGGDTISILDQNGRYVVDTNDEKVANLIAAAPEAVDVCRRIVDHMERPVEDARAVVAKSEGRTND